MMQLASTLGGRKRKVNSARGKRITPNNCIANREPEISCGAIKPVRSCGKYSCLRIKKTFFEAAAGVPVHA